MRFECVLSLEIEPAYGVVSESMKMNFLKILVASFFRQLFGVNIKAV